MRFDWQLRYIRDRAVGKDDTQLVEIIVNPPVRLGNSENGFDYHVIKWANHWGMPAQFVKALIWKESGFNLNSFRYEMAFDANYITNKRFFEIARYAPFAVADSGRTGSPKGYTQQGDSIPQGILVDSMHSDPYSILRHNVLSPQVEVRDIDSNRRISAEELDLLNDRYSYSETDFVAQIVLASSFGSMQPLLISLTDYVGFGMRSPLILFNQEDGIAWGTKMLWHIYWRSNSINSEYSYDTKLKTLAGKYNGGLGANESGGEFIDPSIEDYSDALLGKMAQYQPVK